MKNWKFLLAVLILPATVVKTRHGRHNTQREFTAMLSPSLLPLLQRRPRPQHPHQLRRQRASADRVQCWRWQCCQSRFTDCLEGESKFLLFKAIQQYISPGNPASPCRAASKLPSHLHRRLLFPLSAL